jgi:hypothetical protein
VTDARTLNTQRHDEKIARIRSNPDLSEHAKRRMIGETHREAVAEHARLTQEAREAREEAVRSAERKVLGISYPERASAHEKALIALSYRDARDRAERAAADTDNPDALAEIMERGDLGGRPTRGGRLPRRHPAGRAGDSGRLPCG